MVLSCIDYSLINELLSLDKPTEVQKSIGQVICEFLLFIMSPSVYAGIQKPVTKSWHETCRLIRKQISSSLLDFKLKIKDLVTEPSKVPEPARKQLWHLKLMFSQNKAQLRHHLRSCRVLRVLTQLAWQTICTVLGLKDEQGDFDLTTSGKP